MPTRVPAPLIQAPLIASLLAGLLSTPAALAGGPYVVHTLTPCRVVDTRFADPLLSDFSGDRLAPGETVSFYVTGNLIDGQGGAGDCGVPAEATGVFVNVTAVRPLGTGAAGFLTLYPYGESLPTASTINYKADTTAIANGVLVALCDPAGGTCSYDLSVYNFTNLAVHLVLDVTGYLAP